LSFIEKLRNGAVWQPGAGGYVLRGRLISTTPQYSTIEETMGAVTDGDMPTTTKATTGYTYTPFDFSDALSEIGGYEGLTDEQIQAQANTAAELLAAPQIAAAKEQERRNAVEEYTAARKLKSSQAGVDAAEAWNRSQGQKADALAAAASGANSRSGLVSYLANQRESALAADRLAMAAQMAERQYALDTNSQSNARAISDQLENIGNQQGLAAADYFNQMYNNQLTNRNNYNMNRNQVAASLGTVHNQGQDIAQRNAQANMQNSTTLRGQDIDYTIGLLPYTKMTKKEEADAYNQSSQIYGKSPGGIYIGGRSR
jgi:hypothetical protein